ncbi:hypothetical protein [Oceanisphaera arctica]|uniref:hypothetical protein n=1 Tax=Oceanisphaera arctica TaxID=641510 RepID=UPI0011B043B7|nr:hypothetical protein [Oceanisphaera arctica]GHA09580.1 hypothetical protein GCM10007082_08140 [Oceanisphaera arctica]
MQRPRINECTRCNGIGYIGKWKHIANGICFECEGVNGYVRSSHKKIGRVVENKEKYRQEIMASIASDDSVLSGRIDLLNEPKILDGMATLAEEGFDDEILADYAHQMSKR